MTPHASTWTRVLDTLTGRELVVRLPPDEALALASALFELGRGG